MEVHRELAMKGERKSEKESTRHRRIQANREREKERKWKSKGRGCERGHSHRPSFKEMGRGGEGNFYVKFFYLLFYTKFMHFDAPIRIDREREKDRESCFVSPSSFLPYTLINIIIYFFHIFLLPLCLNF